MLWVILGIILALGTIVLCAIWGRSEGFTAALSAIILVGVGVITPFTLDLGYNKREVEQTVELVTLATDVTSVGSGNRWYVTVSGEKVYTYRYEVENTTELAGTMYKTATISGNVEEVESSECKTPILYIYVEKTKNSLWFSFNTEDRYTYVFYVPEGTIVRDVSLD